MSRPLSIPDHCPSDPALAVCALATLADMRFQEFLPAMRKLEQAEAWAVGLTMQRLGHPDDPAWFVGTPWAVRITSTAFLGAGITGVLIELEVDQDGLRLTLGGPLPSDPRRLAVAVHFAVEGRPFWSACGPGVARTLKLFRQQTRLFGSVTTAEVMAIIPTHGATCAPTHPNTISQGPTD